MQWPKSLTWKKRAQVSNSKDLSPYDRQASRTSLPQSDSVFDSRCLSASLWVNHSATTESFYLLSNRLNTFCPKWMSPHFHSAKSNKQTFIFLFARLTVATLIFPLSRSTRSLISASNAAFVCFSGSLYEPQRPTIVADDCMQRQLWRLQMAIFILAAAHPKDREKVSFFASIFGRKGPVPSEKSRGLNQRSVFFSSCPFHLVWMKEKSRRAWLCFSSGSAR